MARHVVQSEVAGTIWKIEVAPGQAVAQGDTLIVIESMKMEIPVEAGRAGVVRELLLDEGTPVSEGQELLVLDV